MTEQPFSLEALWPRYTVNNPTFQRVPLSDLHVHGRRLVLGSTAYRWGAAPLALEFARSGLVAHGYCLDLTNIQPQIAKVGIHPITMVTRVNGVWGADGAYLLNGNPPVNWDSPPGPDLGAHQLCVDITQGVQAGIRSYELEHIRDFALAWILTVGMFVEALPASGYAHTGDALLALAERFEHNGQHYLVPPDSRTEPQRWVQHIKTRATQLADMSSLRDTNGSHTPLSYSARLDHSDQQHRIILTPVLHRDRQSTPVLALNNLPH